MLVDAVQCGSRQSLSVRLVTRSSWQVGAFWLRPRRTPSGGLGVIARGVLVVARNPARERDEERVQQRENDEHAKKAPNGRRNLAFARYEQAADEQRRGGGADDRRLGEYSDRAGIAVAQAGEE